MNFHRVRKAIDLNIADCHKQNDKKKRKKGYNGNKCGKNSVDFYRHSCQIVVRFFETLVLVFRAVKGAYNSYTADFFADN